jgi:hypothetical protein
MNERIRELAKKAYEDVIENTPSFLVTKKMYEEKFAELIVEECRRVITEVYRNTPLELCGSLLAADEEIAKHFYGVGE